MDYIDETTTIYYWLDGYWTTPGMYHKARKGRKYSIELPRELTTKEVNKVIKIVLEVVTK